MTTKYGVVTPEMYLGLENCPCRESLGTVLVIDIGKRFSLKPPYQVESQPQLMERIGLTLDQVRAVNEGLIEEACAKYDIPKK